MIIGNLNALPLAGLPESLLALLRLPDCSLEALAARDIGRWQPENAAWFCTIQQATTRTPRCVIRNTTIFGLTFR